MANLTNIQGDNAEFPKKLLERLHAGDVHALGRLYDLYIDHLIKVGQSYTKDTDGLEDQIHDLFLELYQSRKRVLEIRNIKSYLVSCLRNKIYKKTKSKELLVDEDTFLHLITQDSNQIQRSTENDQMEKEALESRTTGLKVAMETLTLHQQDIIRLRYVENLSYNEISEHLNVSENSARTLLYRTIKALRKQLSSLFL